MTMTIQELTAENGKLYDTRALVESLHNRDVEIETLKAQLAHTKRPDHSECEERLAARQTLINEQRTTIKDLRTRLVESLLADDKANRDAGKEIAENASLRSTIVKLRNDLTDREQEITNLESEVYYVRKLEEQIQTMRTSCIHEPSGVEDLVGVLSPKCCNRSHSRAEKCSRCGKWIPWHGFAGREIPPTQVSREIDHLRRKVKVLTDQRNMAVKALVHQATATTVDDDRLDDVVDILIIMQ